jgi:hypothetical protein
VLKVTIHCVSVSVNQFHLYTVFQHTLKISRTLDRWIALEDAHSKAWTPQRTTSRANAVRTYVCSQDSTPFLRSEDSSGIGLLAGDQQIHPLLSRLL